MRNRQPADQRMDPYVRRTRRHAWRAAPPSGWSRRARRPGRAAARLRPRAAAAPARSCASSTACLTFVLLLMLLVGAVAYVFDSQIDAPGPLEQAKTVVIPKGEGTHEIASRLEREGIVSDRRLFIAGYLLEQVRGLAARAASRSSSRPATTR